MEKDVKIKISIDNQTKEIKVIKDDFKKLSNNIAQSSEATRKFQKSMARMGHISSAILGVNLSFGALRKTISNTLGVGINYNRSMENLTNGLTTLNVITSSNVTSLGRYVSLQEKYAIATNEAKMQVKDLAKINKETPHTLTQTVQIYKTMYPSMKKVGATTAQLIELTKKLSIATGDMDFNSLLAGVDGLATGTVLANSDLGRFLGALGLTNEELKKSDDVVKTILDKLRDTRGIEGFDTALSNLGNSFSVKAGEFNRSLFKDMKITMLELTKVIDKIDVGNIKELLKDIARIGTDALIAYGALKTAKTLSPIISGLASSFNLVNVQLAAGIVKARLQTIAIRTLGTAMRMTPLGLFATGVSLLADNFLFASNNAKQLQDAYEGVTDNLKKLTKEQLAYKKTLVETEFLELHKKERDLTADVANNGFFEDKEERQKDRADLSEIRQKIKNLRKYKREINNLLSDGFSSAKNIEKLKPSFDMTSINKDIKALSDTLNPYKAKVEAVNKKWSEHLNALKKAGLDTSAVKEAWEKELKFLEDKQSKKINSYKKTKEDQLKENISFYKKIQDYDKAWNEKKKLLIAENTNRTKQELKKLLTYEKEEFYKPLKEEDKKLADKKEEERKKDLQNSLRYYTTIRNYAKSWELEEQRIREENKDLFARLGEDEVNTFLANEEKKFKASFYSYENLKTREDAYKYYLTKMESASKTHGQTLADIYMDVNSAMEKGFTNFFDSTSKGFLDLKDLAKSVGKDIANSIMQKTVVKPLASAGSALVNVLTGSIGSSIGESIGDAFGFDLDFGLDKGGYAPSYDIGGTALKTAVGYTIGNKKKIAGVVHGEEYVAPAYQVKQFPELFRWLNSRRTGAGVAGAEQLIGFNSFDVGFAGGNVGSPFDSSTNNRGDYKDRDSSRRKKDRDHDRKREKNSWDRDGNGINDRYERDIERLSNGGMSWGRDGKFHSGMSSYKNVSDRKWGRGEYPLKIEPTISVLEVENILEEYLKKDPNYFKNISSVFTGGKVSDFGYSVFGTALPDTRNPFEKMAEGIENFTRHPLDTTINAIKDYVNGIVKDVEDFGKWLQDPNIEGVVSFAGKYLLTGVAAKYGGRIGAEIFESLRGAQYTSQVFKAIAKQVVKGDAYASLVSRVSNTLRGEGWIDTSKSEMIEKLLDGRFEKNSGIEHLMQNTVASYYGLNNLSEKYFKLNLDNTAQTIKSFNDKLLDIATSDKNKTIEQIEEELEKHTETFDKKVEEASAKDTLNIVNKVHSKIFSTTLDSLDSYKDGWKNILEEYKNSGMTAIIDDVLKAHSEESYSYWQNIAKQNKKTINEVAMEAYRQVVGTRRTFDFYGLKGTDLAKEQARIAKEDFETLAKTMGVDFANLTTKNFTEEYNKAIAKDFTNENIAKWKNLGDALIKATNAQKSYTNAVEEQARKIDAQATKMLNSYNSAFDRINTILNPAPAPTFTNIKLNDLNKTNANNYIGLFETAKQNKINEITEQYNKNKASLQDKLNTLKQEKEKRLRSLEQEQKQQKRSLLDRKNAIQQETNNLVNAFKNITSSLEDTYASLINKTSYADTFTVNKYRDLYSKIKDGIANKKDVSALTSEFSNYANSYADYIANSAPTKQEYEEQMLTLANSVKTLAGDSKKVSLADINSTFKNKLRNIDSSLRAIDSSFARNIAFATKTSNNRIAQVNKELNTLDTTFKSSIQSVNITFKDSIQNLANILRGLYVKDIKEFKANNTNMSKETKEKLDSTIFSTQEKTILEAFKSTLNWDVDLNNKLYKEGIQYWVNRLETDSNLTTANLKEEIAKVAVLDKIIDEHDKYGYLWLKNNGFDSWLKDKNITPFANGGIVTKPTLGLIGEAGYNEAVIPLNEGNKALGMDEVVKELREVRKQLEISNEIIEEQAQMIRKMNNRDEMKLRKGV